MCELGGVVDFEIRQYIDRTLTKPEYKAKFPWGPKLQIRKKIVKTWAHDTMIYEWTDWEDVPLFDQGVI